MAEASSRLDKWLWHARVTRTRTLAQKLVAAGKVRINREKVASPSRAVRIGDVLTIAAPHRVLVYEIVAFAEKRGSFAEAQKLYADRSVAEPTESEPAERTPEPLPRPDARERRAARAMRGKSV